jgi:sugar lactone lactonase YvrE
MVGKLEPSPRHQPAFLDQGEAMTSRPFAWLSVAGVALLAISFACGGGGGGSATPEVPVAPTITSFSANPTSIDAGTTTALTGIFANGSGVITPGDLAVSSGTAMAVAPITTTTYTLTVTSPTGGHVSQTSTVTVSPYPPSITSFTANPTTINAGGTVELLGYFANGEGVITPGDLQASSSYYTWVTPTVTTTYTLTVTNAAGVAVSKSATVNVVNAAAPVISSFTANPTTITAGAPSDLTATFANGTGVITPGNLALASGSAVTIWPTTTTTYTLTVTNPAGASTTQTATVNVASISVLAGIAGVPGNSNGTGAGGRFNDPFGIARDSSGNLFVADASNNTIRKVTPAGVVSTLAGTAGVQGNADGIGAAAKFYFPTAVVVDADGNVYVADAGNNSVRKITPAGVVSTLASGFSWPSGIAVDGAGTIYVSDSSHDVISIISPSGSVSVLAGTTGAPGNQDGTGSTARFNFPQGLTLDASGNVYVADMNNNAVRKISPNGVVTTLVGSQDYCTDVVLDGGGSLYVSGDGISKISPAGQVMASVVFGIRVQGLVVDPLGNCFGVGNDAVWEIPAVFF